MLKKINVLFIVNISVFMVSCAELSGEGTGANNEQPEQERIGGIDAISAGGNKFLLDGTSENGGNSGHSYRLQFKLPEEEVLKFYFFITDSFSGGAVYSFTRVEGVVKLTISINDLSHTIDLTDFNDSEVVDLDIDIHNDHSDIHVLVWDRNGPHDSAEECTFDGGCLYNSEDFAFDIWLGVGRASGTFWGIQGNKSLILTLEGPLPPLSDA